MTGAPRVDANPIRTAAAAQTPLVAGGPFASGGLVALYLSFAPQPYGRIDALILVALAVGPSLFTSWRALVRTIRRAEPETTPWQDARDGQNRPLTPTDQDLLRLLRQMLRQMGATDRPQRHSPSGTRVAASVEQARPMRVDDAAAFRAADGPPSKRQWAPDYYGDRVREDDEGRARRHGLREPRR